MPSKGPYEPNVHPPAQEYSPTPATKTSSVWPLAATRTLSNPSVWRHQPVSTTSRYRRSATARTPKMTLRRQSSSSLSGSPHSAVKAPLGPGSTASRPKPRRRSQAQRGRKRRPLLRMLRQVPRPRPDQDLRDTSTSSAQTRLLVEENCRAVTWPSPGAARTSSSVRSGSSNQPRSDSGLPRSHNAHPRRRHRAAAGRDSQRP